MKGVRIRLTLEQQAQLAPLITELKNERGQLTIGQLDVFGTAVPSAWFTVAEPARAKRIVEALRSKPEETTFVWVFDAMEADVFEVVTSVTAGKGEDEKE